MWNFSDDLQYKLEFESPYEVTSLSFCPFDDNLLIGGTINGIIIIWDLQNRLNKLDNNEILTSKQLKYRQMMKNHLLWTKQINDNTIIHPAAISSLQTNHNGPIISIKWLDHNYTISQTGHIRKNDEPSTSKYFITTSIDGIIAFWHIESNIEIDKRTSEIMYLYKHHYEQYPIQLIKDISIYEKYDRQIKPIFIIELPVPITGILMDSAKFHYEPQYHQYNCNEMIKNFQTKIPIKVTSIKRDEITQNFYVSSLYGQMIMSNWNGLSHSISDISKEKIITLNYFAKIHDGPIIGIESNPFLENIILTYGGTIFAIWQNNIFDYPIIWRQIHTRITQIKWSCDRPGVIYLTAADGTLQIWDLLSK